MRSFVTIGVLALLPLAAAPAHDGTPSSQAHEVAAPVSIPARIVADPRTALSMVVPEDGRLLAPAGGFPRPGQRVVAGQVLATLVPAFPQSERRDIGMELAAQQRDEYINKLQLDRYQIDGTRPFDIKLPTPTVQLVADYRSAHAQAGELRQALARGMPLRAATDAVVLRAPARADRTLLTGQTAFELRPAAAFAIAAEFIDDDLDVATARSPRFGDAPLRLIGSSYDLALRLHRAVYAPGAPGTAQIGEPLQLSLQRVSARPHDAAPPIAQRSTP